MNHRWGLAIAPKENLLKLCGFDSNCGSKLFREVELLPVARISEREDLGHRLREIEPRHR